MASDDGRPRALFISPKGSLVPDSLICSGFILSQMNGRACPYSDHGRMPLPRRPDGLLQRLRSTIKAAEGDLPPCALTELGRLEDWDGRSEVEYPPALSRLGLFKCRQMLLFVVPKAGEEFHFLPAYQDYSGIKQA